ncbi:MAG: hypothetical protein KBI01_09525, partial [Oscillospiraceae bacterium]|nr:hypothetical protein [Oscillospiraceae bacterium]
FDIINSFYLEEYDYDIYNVVEETIDEDRKKDTIIRCIVDYLITTLIRQSEARLSIDLRAYEIDNVYIKYDDSTNEIVNDFHKYLNELIFSDPRINEMDRRGMDIIESLFLYFKKEPDKLPESTKQLYSGKGICVLGDYIAGMTDRYALNQYYQMINL